MALFFTCLLSVNAETTIVEYGCCGENATWTVDNEWTLTVNGTGEMRQPNTTNWGKIKKVIINEGITSIGYYSFGGFPKLTSVTIPSTVVNIGESAFEECGKLTSIDIPQGVIKIGEGAFQFCEKLSSINVPISVINIGQNAFNGTAWYETKSEEDDMIVVNNILCDGLGYSCNNLFIPSNVVSISDGAFECCESIENVYIERDSKLEIIGDRAFNGCKDLSKIEDLPQSIKDIGIDAFNGTAWLKNKRNEKPLVIVNSVLYDGRKCSGHVDIPANIKSISGGAFRGCKELTSVSFPEGLEKIGKESFYNCDKLTDVIIPNNIDSIEPWSFDDCALLKNITIPASIKTIGEYAFSSCPKMTSVEIPNGVEKIDDCAFQGCTNLSNITIPSSVKEIGASAFSKTKWFTVKKQENPLVIINDLLYDGKACTGSVEIPNGVKIICDCAFNQNVKVTSVTIPNSTTDIGGAAFMACDKLSKVVMSDNITYIGDEAFDYCEKLKYLDIPETLHNVGGGVVYGKDLYLKKDSYSDKYMFDDSYTKIYVNDKQPHITTYSLKTKSFAFDGSDKKPRVILKDENGKVFSDIEDYTIEYVDNMNVGTAIAVVNLKGNYEGNIKLEFVINPKGTNLGTLKAAKKGFSVKWKKQSSKMSTARITGYQLQYSMSNKFKSGIKSVNIKGYSKVSSKVSKLKAKKKYFVRIRTYMKVNGQTYYSSWSKSKSIKTK